MNRHFTEEGQMTNKYTKKGSTRCPLEKCKLKQHYDFIFPQKDWPVLRNQIVPNAIESTGEKEPFHTVSGNAS